MFVALQEVMSENTRPATDELTELLAGFGFDAETLDIELAIDRFDQWTNPREASLVTSSCGFYGSGDELVRAA